MLTKKVPKNLNIELWDYYSHIFEVSMTDPVKQMTLAEFLGAVATMLQRGAFHYDDMLEVVSMVEACHKIAADAAKEQPVG